MQRIFVVILCGILCVVRMISVGCASGETFVLELFEWLDIDVVGYRDGYGGVPFACRFGEHYWCVVKVFEGYIVYADSVGFRVARYDGCVV